MANRKLITDEDKSTQRIKQILLISLILGLMSNPS
jgi:hypothetical protein